MQLEEISIENAAEKLLSGQQDTTCYLYDVSTAETFDTIVDLHKVINLSFSNPHPHE